MREILVGQTNSRTTFAEILMAKFASQHKQD
jgi:hypothetical protein